MGQLLGGRYKVLGDAGKGVFSCVVRAIDINTNQNVVVKIVRYNEYMKRVGKQEIKSFELLSKSDPNDQFHCVRMLDNFEDRGLLCNYFYIYYLLFFYIFIFWF
jgi:serine/threonine-protein kinase PRP4